MTLQIFYTDGNETETRHADLATEADFVATYGDELIEAGQIDALAIGEALTVEGWFCEELRIVRAA